MSLVLRGYSRTDDSLLLTSNLSESQIQLLEEALPDLREVARTDAVKLPSVLAKKLRGRGYSKRIEYFVEPA